MTNTIRIKVYPDLVRVFEQIREGIAKQMKKEYNLKEIVIPNTLASQVLAAEKLNKKVSFKLRKTGLFTGELELTYL